MVSRYKTFGYNHEFQTPQIILEDLTHKTANNEYRITHTVEFAIAFHSEITPNVIRNDCSTFGEQV